MENDRSMEMDFPSMETLPPEWKTLMDSALISIRLAFPSGSGVHIGCAGAFKFTHYGPRSVFTGFNVEKISYNDGVHAEECMFLSARRSNPAAFEKAPKSLVGLAVAGDVGGLVSPCGACLDWMVDYSSTRTIPVLMKHGDRVVVRPLNVLIPDIEDLLSNGGIKERGEGSVEVDGLLERSRGYFREADGWCADRPRFSAMRLGSGEWRFGGTISQAAYHGVQSIEGLTVGFRNEMRKPTDLIDSVYIVGGEGNRGLPFGCERQWLFGAARSQDKNIDVYVVSDGGGVLKTDAFSLLPYGFSVKGL